MASQRATRIGVEGIAVSPGSTAITRGGTRRRHEFEVRPVAEFDLGAARGGTGSRPEFDVPDNGVVELEFEDGFRVFTAPESIPRDFGSITGRPIDRGAGKGVGGGAATSPEAADGPDLQIPRQLVPRRGQVVQRGAFGWILRRLKVFDTAAARSAESICTYYEDSIARKQGVDQLNTLCRLSLDGEARLDPITGELGAQDGPLLLFLHGTASSTCGSFGRLWPEGEVGARALLQRRYGNRVFSFEHRTLTESPIRNALDLVRQLPERAVVHIVSHSRGGLIGELLCRGERIQDGASPAAPFTSEEIEQYLKRLAEGTTKEGAASDRLHVHRQDLEALSMELEKRKLKVERFVRVACPARGTTLASERFDLFLSALANILEQLPGFAGDVAGLFADMARALIAQRADPRILPGLEAMMPDSALVWLVNHREVRVRSDLAVIAGDIEGAGVLGRMAVFLSDLFFGGQHDLVIDTDFMVGGARRVSETWRFFTQGVDVSHFGYFAEGRARTALLNALDRAGSAPQGYAAFDLDAGGTDAAGKPDAGTRGIPGLCLDGGKARDRKILRPEDLVAGRDVVFLLPGIMGSHLKAGGARVWLEYLRLIGGGFELLKPDATDVLAERVLDDYYARLALHLADSMQVVEWPYDWRIAVADSAVRLANDVRIALDRIGPTGAIRFVGHSMGGLVVRALALEHPPIWNAVCAREGSRFLMLGTPNRGTWSAVQLLIGRDDVTSQLAFADTRHSHRELLQIIRRFPGVLDLLPHGDDAIFDPQSWETWEQRDKDYLLGRVTWTAPEPADLKRAGAYAKRLDAQLAAWSAPGSSPKIQIGYIAGSAPLTPHGISRVGPLEVVGSSGGDGRVRWDSAAGDDDASWLDIYHVPVAHGDLAAHQAAFKGITEWLQRGATSELARARPQLRGDDVSLPLLPSYENSRAEASLTALAVGSTSRRNRDRDGFTPRVREVSVAHAHLREARFDVLLGHYRGVDVLMNAEQELDGIMDGALKQALDLRQFPGDLNRSRLFVRPGSLRWGNGSNGGSAPTGVGGPDDGPKWPTLAHAIVTGLGTPGELTPSTLRETVLNALLSYALRQLELASVLDGRKVDGAIRMGLSSTLIGTSTSMVSVEDAVVSIIGAAEDANRRLNEAGHALSFEWVEFIELWQDQAIEAVRALKRAQQAFRLDPGIRLPSEIEEGEGGLVREGAFDDSKWWSRLRIASTAGAMVATGAMGGRGATGAKGATGAMSGAGRGYGELKFTLHTDRARLESRLLGTQRRQIDRFVTDAISSRPPPEGIAETLYQLLLPNELKGDALTGRRLVLLVDEHSAGYPWEMLKGDGEAARVAPALSGGIVRQLDLENFRERGDLVTKGTAFVVGDPLLSADGRPDGPGQLPGARMEAELVQKLLNAESFCVTSMIQARGTDIVRILMSQRFQILHLAGHGQYQADADDGATVTGMLLGDGWYLTANEIGQMQGIPELVFVNCCHLGRTDSAIVGTSLDAPHRFAASLATQLMKNGVRCVIAAGWAIDDDAAQTFAQTFYEAFVGDRETFGEAVRKARVRCHALRPQSNTWAAFQCYGDPQFRLTRPDKGDDVRPTTRTQRSYVSAVEVISHLMNIPVGSRNEKLERARTRIEEIEAQIRPAWRRRGDVLAALGDAYRRARNFEAAIGCYENALVASGGNPGLNVLERIADLKGLMSVERYLDDLESTHDLGRKVDLDDVADVDEAVDKLEWIARAASSPTRRVMHAWACKRAIILSRSDADRKQQRLEAIKGACASALGQLYSEDLGARSDSRLRRIRCAGVMMQATASIALTMPALRKMIAKPFEDLRDQLTAGGTDWDELYRLGLDWAIDLASLGPPGLGEIFEARKAVDPVLQRFADSPRLWSIAREQWWFCQLLREGVPPPGGDKFLPGGGAKQKAKPTVGQRAGAGTAPTAASPQYARNGRLTASADTSRTADTAHTLPGSAVGGKSAKASKAAHKANGTTRRERVDGSRVAESLNGKGAGSGIRQNRGTVRGKGRVAARRPPG